MVPLAFIIIVSLILVALIYWVLNTMRFDEAVNEDDFLFEAAPELFAYGTIPDLNSYLPFETNRLKLGRANKVYLIAYWSIEEEKQEEFYEKTEVDGDLVLRIYQTSFGLIYDEFPVENLKGSHYFESKPETAYYAVLGIKKDDSFFPWLYSNTVMTAVPKKAAKKH
jgi:uncharacterized membrane protein YwzB